MRTASFPEIDDGVLPPGFPTKWADVSFGQFIEIQRVYWAENPALLLAILYSSPHVDADGGCRMDIGAETDRTSLLHMFTSIVRKNGGCLPKEYQEAVQFLKQQHGFEKSPPLSHIPVEGELLPVPEALSFMRPELLLAFMRNEADRASGIRAVLLLGLEEFNSSRAPQHVLDKIAPTILAYPLHYVYSTAVHLYNQLQILKTFYHGRKGNSSSRGSA